MWAMIACCIALGLWTAGLLWFIVRAEKRRATLVGECNVGEEKGMSSDLKPVYD